MQVFGVDLAEWVVAGRWEALLELIDQLPAACRLNEAIAQDEEAAESLLELQEASGGAGRAEWSPRVSEFDLTNSLLVSLINEVKTLRLSGQAMAGAKPKKEDPFPTPRTALERVRARLEMEAAKELSFAFGFSEEDFN